MSLRIEVLSGLGDKAPAAILVEAEGRRLLLDAGGALHPGQSMAWVDGLDVDAVLISHDHIDHIGWYRRCPPSCRSIVPARWRRRCPVVVNGERYPSVASAEL